MMHCCAERYTEHASLLMYVLVYMILCAGSLMQGAQEDSDPPAAMVTEDNLAESLGEAWKHCSHYTSFWSMQSIPSHPFLL